MAIYILALDQYEGELKIGLSTNTINRVKQHIKSSGKINLLEEWETPVGVSDKVVERELLNSFRGCPISLISPSKQYRYGWTEFVPLETISAIREKLTLVGYTKSQLNSAYFKDEVQGAVSGRFGKAYGEVSRSMRVLEVVDTILLTCGFCKSHVPASLEDFEDMCEKHGEPSGWLHSDMPLEIARSLEMKYPYGVLQPSSSYY